MKARQPGHIWSDMGPGLQMALRDAWRADIFKGATSSSTSLLPRVGDQIFSVLKLLCLLFQVIQELLPSKGACGHLGGLILLPQAHGQQCILQWWLRGRCRERERERKRESGQLPKTRISPETPPGTTGAPSKWFAHR